MARAEIKAGLSLDKSGFSRGIAGAKTESKGLGAMAGQLKGQLAAAFSIGAVIAFTRNMGNVADQVLGTSDAVGVSAESVQALGVAYARAGGQTQDAATMLDQLTRSQGGALAGQTKLQKQFSLMGVSMAELKTMGTAQLLDRIAAAYNTSNGSATAMAATLKLVGGTAQTTNAVMRELSEGGVAGLTQRMQEAGQVISTETLQQWDLLNDRIDDSVQRMKGWAAEGLTTFQRSMMALGGVIGGLSWEEAWNAGEQIDAEDRAAKARERQQQKAEAARSAAAAQEEKDRQTYDALLQKQAEEQDKLERSRLTAAQRLLRLEKDIAESRRTASTAAGEGRSADVVKANLETIRLEGEADRAREEVRRSKEAEAKSKADQKQREGDVVGKARREMAEARRSSGFRPEAADSLARIGGYIGGQMSTGRAEIQRQLRLEEELVKIQRDALRELAELRKGSTATYT